MILRVSWHWPVSTTIAVALLASEVCGQTQVSAIRITRAEFHNHVHALGLNDAQLLPAKAIFESYQAEFARSLEAEKQLIAWVYSHGPGRYKTSDRDLNTVLAADELSIENRWQLGARALERRYFRFLGALGSGLETTAASLRRARLRRRLLSREELLDAAPFGVALEVFQFIEGAAEDHLGQLEVASIFAEYEIKLDQILQRLDQCDWQNDQDRRHSTKTIRELRRDDVSGAQLTEEIDALVEVLVQPGALYHEIRALNSATIENLVARVPEEAAPAFFEETHPLLFGFMYDPEGPSPRLIIRDAMRSLNVTETQRADLLVARDAFDEARLNATTRLEPLYDQLISPKNHRAWRRAWLQHVYLGIPIENSAESAQQAFDEALQRWMARQASFKEQIRGILATGS